jgi:hypothetical protein
MAMRFQIGLLMMAGMVALVQADAQEAWPQSVVIEAETLGPLKGNNFSFEPVERTTKGTWSLGGPGVAAEWTQGGESEFLSIAARADEKAGVSVGREIELPAAGKYRLWVRYADYRKKREEFGVRIRQRNQEVLAHVFGTKDRVDPLDPMSLRWDFVFTWDKVEVSLEKGPARIELYTTGPTEARRHVDLMVLTTDETYQPTGREKPNAAAWGPLRDLMKKGMGDAHPLANSKRLAEIPAEWKITGRPPVFVWNTGDPWLEELKRPADRIDVAFGVDPPLLKDFLAAYRGKEIPVFGSKLSGPSWGISNYPKVFADGSPFIQWLERHPQQRFTLMLNYSNPDWPKGADRKAVYANLKKYMDRCAGFVAGESVAHTGYDSEELSSRIKNAKTRGDVLAALRDAHTLSVAKKFSDYYGQPVSAAEAWAPVMSCLSGNNEAFCHALLNWGCKQIGHENTGNSPTLARRLAFLRGAARQFGAKLCDYQSANLGDAATMFSRQAFLYPASSRNILDNSYDAFAGAGVNWLLKDYALFFLAGCDAFYNEQGVDMFWKPGGIVAGDGFPVQLSPKGKVAQAIIDLAEKHSRGTQYTPIAFLLDEAHGWSQERFRPGAFGLEAERNPAVLTPGRHEAALRGWFDIAYFPAPDTQNEPASAIRQTYVNGVFGDIFDVVVTAESHAQIIKTYPVLIAAGDVPLSAQWGKALNDYVQTGGVLVVCADTFTGPGAAALKLPAGGAAAEAASIVWKPTGEKLAANVFRYRPIEANAGEILATAANGEPIAAAYPRGRGKLIYVSIPMGLGINNRPAPLLDLLLRDLAATMVPVTVEGDVEKAFNRLDDGGWLITLLNNRGVIKPQHGILPTDYREAQEVKLVVPFKVKSRAEWMAGEEVSWKEHGSGAEANITVPAGSVRMVAIHPEQ